MKIAATNVLSFTDLSDVSTADLLAFYSERTGKNLTKFPSRAKGKMQVWALIEAELNAVQQEMIMSRNTYTVEIDVSNLRGAEVPLYKVYQNQNKPQPAFVELDENGNVSADIDYEIGGAVPVRVAHNRTLRWGVSPYAQGDSLADLLESERVRELFERVHNGHSVEWNGRNMVGRLTEDAEAAALELEAILSPESCEYELAQAIGAYEFIADWFRLEELVEAGSVSECAKRQLESNDSGLVVVDDMEEAVAERAAELIEHNLDHGRVVETTVRAAEILAAWSAHDFSKLLEDVRDEFESE